jgi:hypothetical protein
MLSAAAYPVVFRVGHHSLDFGFSGPARRGTHYWGHAVGRRLSGRGIPGPVASGDPAAQRQSAYLPRVRAAAAALARKNPQARLLLTTFSEPLAQSLAAKLVVLAPDTGGIAPRITVSDWHRVADELFQLIHGRRPRIVAPDILRTMIAKAAEAAGVRGFTQRFLLSEWTNVVDAWGIDGPERYASVPRLGRRSPLGPRQRERLWSVFGPVAAVCASRGFSPAVGCVAGSQRIMAGANASRSITSSSTKRRISGLPSFPSSPPSRRRARTHCFSPATSASGFFSTRFRGKLSASMCGGARRP